MFELSPSELKTPGKTCLYSDSPEVREAVGEGLRELVARHSTTVFGGHCGRCGNSCRRPLILVREAELLALQQRLGLSEGAFRERYLEPFQGTWNPGDAQMRHQDGACPLLEGNTCTVYEVRPQSCRDFRSDKPFCVKDPELLIEELASVTVGPHETRMVLLNGEVHQVPTPPAWWQRLTDVSGAAVESDPRKYAVILEKALVILGGVEGEVSWEGHRETLEGLETLLGEAGELVHLQPDLQGALEEGWSRVRALLARLEKPEAEVGDTPAGPRPAGLEWLHLSETLLTVQRADQPPEVRELGREPELAALAWDFVRALLERPEDSLQLAVQESDPTCTMCGECCRLFAVEVAPSELRVLVAATGLPADAFTLPPRFGWNPGNRILRKVPTPLFPKRLRELPLAPPQGQGVQCIFLKRRDDGLFGCGVYAHRPHPCRAFQPTSALCRHTNSAVNPGRQAHSLRSVRLDAEGFQLHTARGHDAVRIPRGAWQEVDAAARALEAAALGLANRPPP